MQGKGKLKLKTVSNNIKDKVKTIVLKYDAEAEVILFGSRARGDYHEESDWDFLILTEKNSRAELIKLEKQIRSDVFDEIEMRSFDVVQTIIRNKKVWEEKLWVSPFYESVKEDGVKI